MKNSAKIALAIGGTLALVGGAVALTLYLTDEERKNRKEEEDAKEKANKGKENVSEEDKKSLIGKEVWSNDASGVAIRTSAMINNSIFFKNSSDVAWYDVSDNGITENANGMLGTLVRIDKGEDKRDWYYIKLATPIKGYEYGYVRNDVVVIK